MVVVMVVLVVDLKKVNKSLLEQLQGMKASRS